MVPLLEIKTIPIEIQVKTKNASLEFTRGTVEMEVSRTEQGGVDVRSRPIHVRLDTFENRAAPAPVFPPPSAPVSTPVSAPVSTPVSTPVSAPVSTASSAATPAAYEATTAYEDQGQLMLNARLGSIAPTAQTAEQQNYAAPQSSAEPMEWEDGAMEIRYGMDKLNFDWKIEKGEFKFTPGDIQFTVKQRPAIIIKYTGGPIYVPRSADPNYKPVNMRV